MKNDIINPVFFMSEQNMITSWPDNAFLIAGPLPTSPLTNGQ